MYNFMVGDIVRVVGEHNKGPMRWNPNGMNETIGESGIITKLLGGSGIYQIEVIFSPSNMSRKNYWVYDAANLELETDPEVINDLTKEHSIGIEFTN